MATAHVVDLDGYEFPRRDVPFRGPLVETTPQKWVKQDVLGSADPGSILTLVGTESPEWDFVSRAITATKEKLEAVFAGQTAVTLKTPQNPTTGFSVVMTKLKIRHDEPIEDGRWLCSFTLIKR